MYWQGGATAVAQVSTQTFGTYDATTTRKITIGGVTISAVDSGGNLTAALTALAALLNASTHPYFSTITWTSSATTITGTADVAGIPFTMTGAVSGGTGTVSNSGVQVDTTANAGPNNWGTIANWYTALGTPSSALPTSGDTVIFANNSVDVRWGLTTGVTGVTLIRQDLTYTGKIGLDYKVFVTGSDGSSTASYPEYRPCYVSIGCVTYRHGDNPTFGSASGSSRSLWDFGTTTACTMDIINTSSNSNEANRPCLRLLGTKSTHSLNVRSAPGGVGICNEIPGETASMIVNIADTTSTSKVVTGTGFTLITWSQSGGNNVLASNATMPTITVTGGTLRLEGTGAITTLNCYSGTTNANSSGAIATINLQGGNLSGFGSSVARTWGGTAFNVYPDSSYSYDPAVITLSNYAGQRRLTIATS